jgi:methyl-accepting chemotaxis protein
MKFSMTLGKRIAFGIIVMLLLMAMVGSAGYYGLNRVLSVMEFNNTIQAFQNIVSSIKEQTDQYQLNIYAAENDRKEAARKEVFVQLDGGINLVAQLKNVAIMGKDGKEQLSTAETEIKKYKDDFNGLIGTVEKRSELNEQIRNTSDQFVKDVKGQFLAESVETAGSIFISAYITYNTQNSEENWEQVKHNADMLKKAMDEWHKKVESSEELSALSKKLATYYESISANLQAYHAQVVDQQIFRENMNNRKNNLNNITTMLGNISKESLQKQIDFSLKIIVGFLVAGLLFGTSYAIVSTKRIVGKIETAIRGVARGAEQVDAYSKQVSGASHSLAEGSSEQAASIEETSSSLEEMASMTEQNAANASEADNVMKEVNQIVGQANESMVQLTSSISEISSASEETSKIIKTIDEIAFQTNLLALNAAVEAARAGEAGAGFAVVADEVRNLSMRAADAARNTATLIEGTVKKVREGSRLVSETDNAFSAVADSAGKVGDLVGEIAAASREQAQGIGQVNRAVTEMDKVVQQNAANSEESASSAEQLTAQAEKLKVIVDDLGNMVGGNRKQKKKDAGKKGKKAGSPEKGAEKTILKRPELAAPAKSAKGKSSEDINAIKAMPEQIASMKDDDFADF